MILEKGDQGWILGDIQRGKAFTIFQGRTGTSFQKSLD